MLYVTANIKNFSQKVLHVHMSLKIPQIVIGVSSVVIIKSRQRQLKYIQCLQSYQWHFIERLSQLNEWDFNFFKEFKYQSMDVAHY